MEKESKFLDEMINFTISSTSLQISSKENLIKINKNNMANHDNELIMNCSSKSLKYTNSPSSVQNFLLYSLVNSNYLIINIEIFINLLIFIFYRIFQLKFKDWSLKTNSLRNYY